MTCVDGLVSIVSILGEGRVPGQAYIPNISVSSFLSTLRVIVIGVSIKEHPDISAPWWRNVRIEAR